MLLDKPTSYFHIQFLDWLCHCGSGGVVKAWFVNAGWKTREVSGKDLTPVLNCIHVLLTELYFSELVSRDKRETERQANTSPSPCRLHPKPHTEPGFGKLMSNYSLNPPKCGMYPLGHSSVCCIFPGWPVMHFQIQTPNFITWH